MTRAPDLDTLHDLLQQDDLRHPDSVKWMTYGPDVLPLWIADMDFPVAPGIVDALHDRLDRSIGYGIFTGEPAFVKAVLDDQARRGLGGLTPEHAWLLPGVVPGLYAAVLGLTAPGDEVLTHTPIYPPFLGAITNQGRVARHAPLRQGADQWEIDWDTMDAAVTPATRVLLLCNPHNPTGRVWTREELERLAAFALHHRLWVVSDELHADLVLDGAFIPFASLAPEVAARTVTLIGPAKAYNTAGLGIGMALAHDRELLARLQKVTFGVMGHPSALAQTAWHAALLHAGPWLSRTLDYLRGNRDHLTARVVADLPGVRFVPPQATYLAWLDVRAFSFADRPQAHFLEVARVGLNDGVTFGPEFGGFVRLNFATSRAILDEALDRMARALH